MGWKIVAHSFSLVFHNLPQALRVSLGPLVIAILAGWLTFRLLGVTPQMIMFGVAMGRVAPQAAVAISLTMICLLFCSAWVAVAWHRFVLLEEYPGLLPGLHGGPIAGYAGRSILLAVLMVVVMFPVSAIIGQVLSLAGIGGFAVVRLMMAFGLATLFTYLWLRIAIVLPATAIGRSYSLSQGWNDGTRLSGDILSAAAIVVACNMVVSVLTGIIPTGPWLGLGLQAAIGWVTIMVGSSLLTTLYGHLAEGRSLPS